MRASGCRLVPMSWSMVERERQANSLAIWESSSRADNTRGLSFSSRHRSCTWIINAQSLPRCSIQFKITQEYIGLVPRFTLANCRDSGFVCPLTCVSKPDLQMRNTWTQWLTQDVWGAGAKMTERTSAVNGGVPVCTKGTSQHFVHWTLGGSSSWFHPESTSAWTYQ